MLKQVLDQMTEDPTCKFSLNRGQRQTTFPENLSDAEFAPTKGVTLVMTTHDGAKNESAPLLHEEVK